jgi:hypothetical protein
MKIETDRATATSVLGTITGLLMIALLAAPGASYAQQASSPNSVLIEMSPKGEVLKVTKADGTPIPRVENHYARSKTGAKGGNNSCSSVACIVSPATAVGRFVRSYGDRED